MSAEVDPLVQRAMSGAETLPDVVAVWAQHRTQLRAFTYAVSLDSSPNAMPWPAKIDLEERAYLRSAFGHNFIYFLNDDLFGRMVRGERPQIPVDYSIGFDSNTASYVRGMVENLGDEGDRRVFQTIMQRLSLKGFNWDMLPYLMERSEALAAGHDLYSIYAVVRAAETFAACDREHFVATGQIRALQSAGEIETRVEAQIGTWRENYKKGIGESMAYQHGLFYAVILKIALIQRMNPRGKDAPGKTAELIEWMCGQLGCLFPSMLWAGAQYFERGGGFEFFKKLGRKKEEILRQIQNVAWDAYHVYNRQQLTGSVLGDGSFTIPYFLTFDRGLAEFFDGFPQRGCFVHREQRSPQFVADRTIERDVLNRWLDNPALSRACDNYLSPDAVARRLGRLDMSRPLLPPIISHLEAQLLAVVV